MTISFDTAIVITDPNFAPTVGDKISLSANNCTETAYDDNGAPYISTANGSMIITFNDLAGKDLSVSIQQLSETRDDGNGNPLTSTIHGDLHVTSSDTATSTIDTISGESLYFLSPQDNIQITNFTIRDETTSTSLIENAEFGINSSDLGGHIDVVYTDVTFIFGDIYPSSGKMIFTAENKILTVNILSNTQVSVEEDNNKDGIADTTTTMNWVDFQIQ